MKEISLKTKEEIEIMRAGGKIAARVLEMLKSCIKEGVTTEALDKIAEKEILKSGAKPSFKGFHNYPGSICVSINDEVVHGLPSDRIIKNGDLVGIDVGVFYKGFHSDTALTAFAGNISQEAARLLDITKKALDRGIAVVKDGVPLGDVQYVIQNVIESAGFGVIRDLAGHGIGRELQETPSIPNFGKKGQGLVLKEGMTLAIEPMVAVGDWHVKVKSDGWTVVTADRSLAAHFEHTIAVTKDGAEILTKV